MDQNIIEAACEAALQKPFKWGSDDSCTFVCDVLARSTGRDPMAELRGKYRTADEAEYLVNERGGLVKVVQRLAQAGRFEQVFWPFDGAEFGIIAGINGPMMALWAGDKWVARGLNGPVVSPRRAGVLAWRKSDA